MNPQSNSPPSQKRQLANWIISYTNAISSISESPTAYNYWAAISAISATLKDNVWIDRGIYKVFPNQYIILVGPPGIGKGNALHTAHSFVKNPTSNLPLANYIQDRITAQKLIDTLAVGWPRAVITSNGNLVVPLDSTCVLHASELASLLNSSEYMSTLLCETWDRPDYSYSTKSGGKTQIKNMCVSLIGACVQNFVQDINKNGNGALNNGFTARTLFIFAEKKSQSIVWPKKLDPILTQKLNNDLQIISRLHGEYCFEPASQIIFEQKYRSIASDDRDSNIMRDFKARQPIHILKVAMALSAAGSDSLIITQWAMETAINFVDSVLLSLDSCFRGMGESPLAQAFDRIQTYIEKKGVCPRKDIIRDNMQHVHPSDLETILITLANCGVIKEIQSGGVKLYKFIGRASNTP
jgi:hypothetical protein